ncbi:MAG TPA: glycosyltransferase family 2 protein [Bryobacteraceae bacterium]|nr:glycosyltransferase family 2 protein [Bryobacteraceae bacterium]
MSDIGVVVVTYNSAAVIGACLDAAMGAGADLVVVDNASTDATLVEVKRRSVRLIANSTNRGFAAAVNQGCAELNCPYLLLLNPDAILASDLDPLRAACDLPNAAGAGGRLLGADGQPQAGFMVRRLPTPAALILEALLLNRVWPGNPINRKYRSLDLDDSRLQPVEQPAGAFLMIRRDVWQALGGLDERFWPVWFEDVDFCRRAIDAGYSLHYAPQAVAKHTGAHSFRALTLEMRRIYWYRSLLRYSAKHFRRPGVRAVCLAVVAGSCVRAVLESALEMSLRPIAAYGSVVRLAGRAFFGHEVGGVPSVLNLKG